MVIFHIALISRNAETGKTVSAFLRIAAINAGKKSVLGGKGNADIPALETGLREKNTYGCFSKGWTEDSASKRIRNGQAVSSRFDTKEKALPPTFHINLVDRICECG